MNHIPYKIGINANCFVREEDQTYTTYGQTQIPSAHELEKYETSFFITSDASGNTSPYLRTLPHDIDILRNADLGTNEVNNKDVMRQTQKFISVFQRILLNNHNIVNSFSYLSPLNFKWLEDDSVLIEWIFKDFRIGFSIEPVEQDSSWYLVSNQNLEEVSKSGLLDMEDLEPLLVNLLDFASSNS